MSQLLRSHKGQTTTPGTPCPTKAPINLSPIKLNIVKEGKQAQKQRQEWEWPMKTVKGDLDIWTLSYNVQQIVANHQSEVQP